MRFTLKTMAGTPAEVAAEVGAVTFNGARLLPHEASMLAQALDKCAQQAHEKAAEAIGQLLPVGA
jgi:hypothetical protein